MVCDHFKLLETLMSIDIWYLLKWALKIKQYFPHSKKPTVSTKIATIVGKTPTHFCCHIFSSTYIQENCNKLPNETKTNANLS